MHTCAFLNKFLTLLRKLLWDQKQANLYRIGTIKCFHQEFFKEKINHDIRSKTDM